MSITKLTVNLPDTAIADLTELANTRRTTRTEALRVAIATDKFLADQEKSGAKILIERPDGKFERVIRR